MNFPINVSNKGGKTPSGKLMKMETIHIDKTLLKYGDKG